MRVLVVSKMYPNCANEVLGTFVEEQVEALIRYGCEIKVVAPVPYSPFPFSKISKRWGQYLNIPSQDFRKGVEVYHPRYIQIPHSLIGDSMGYSLSHLQGRFVCWGIKKVVTDIVADFKPEIIHAHGVFPIGCGVALLRRDLKTNNIKLVITGHRGDILIAYKSRFLMKRTRFALNNSDSIITVSHKFKDIASSISDRNHVRVIPNGVNIERFELSAEDIKWIDQKKKDFNGKKILLFVGWIIERKGIKELLEAFKQLSSNRNDILLLLVGGIGPEEFVMKKYLTDYINANTLDEKIKVVGTVKHEEVKLWMNLCDIFVLPSHSEGLPVAMLEAMACGKPVIVSDVGGVSEVLQDGRNGLLSKPKDARALARAINFLLDNPDEARDLGKEAKKVISDNYTWSINAERNMDVYRELIQS